MRVIYSRCAALDVHKRTVVACRRRMRPEGGLEQEIKTFGTTMPELLALVDWLLAWEISHVAMESTGEYWKPVYNLLEGQVKVYLVNAKHVHQVPGRKTDQQDAESPKLETGAKWGQVYTQSLTSPPNPGNL